MISGQDHSRCANAALGAAAIKKRLLQCMKLFTSREPLYRRDLSTLGLQHRDEAAIHERPVHQNCTRAALALSATFLCSRKPQFLAEHVKQSLHRIDPHCHQFPVDLKRNVTLGAILRRLVHRPSSATEEMLSRPALRVTASKMSSGSKGIESNGTPRASSTALMTAGAGPSIGSSPIPFAPYAP